MSIKTNNKPQQAGRIDARQAEFEKRISNSDLIQMKKKESKVGKIQNTQQKHSVFLQF
jgi:hypothetical protein